MRNGDAQQQLLADIGYDADTYVRYFEAPLLAKCAEDANTDANNRIQASSLGAYLAYVRTSRPALPPVTVGD
jgi:hypothetical protein